MHFKTFENISNGIEPLASVLFHRRKKSMDLIREAALLMISVDSSISLEEAENRIKKYTGFPASEADKDEKYCRLTWDEYFISLAFLVSMRSPDAQTQHGCVIVDRGNKIVSTGCNGFLPDAIDDQMPNLRPKKYLHIIHAEVNAILSAKQDLNGCKMYITGLPCNECLKFIAKSNIKTVIVGDRLHVFSDGYLELQSFICANHGISIQNFSGKIASLDGRKIGKTNEKK